jgi:hypothetical protein
MNYDLFGCDRLSFKSVHEACTFINNGAKLKELKSEPRVGKNQQHQQLLYFITTTAAKILLTQTFDFLKIDTRKSTDRDNATMLIFFHRQTLDVDIMLRQSYMHQHLTAKHQSNIRLGLPIKSTTHVHASASVFGVTGPIHCYMVHMHGLYMVHVVS